MTADQAWCAVLAAGQGARFGGGKLSADLAGRPLLRWAVDTALAAGLERVLVVLGAEAEDLRALLPSDPRLEVLVNPRHQEGMGTSLAVAARRARESGAEVLAVLLGDQPLVAPATVAAVAQAACTAPSGAAAATAGAQRGHPVAFTRRHFAELAKLEGDQGGRALLGRLGQGVALLPAAQASLVDVDRPADLERVRALLAPAGPGLGLALGLEGPGLWAMAGSGGKTSLLYALAGELHGQGRPVILTTSTRIYPPPVGVAPQTWLLGQETPEIAQLEQRLAPGQPLCLAQGRQADGKLQGLAPAQLAALLTVPGLWVFCEADGAAGRPLKGWASHEPALVGRERGLIVVAGASGLGRPLGQRWVHRPEMFAKASGLGPGQAVTPMALARVLGGADGPLRGLAAGARAMALINQAESAPPALLRELGAALEGQGRWDAVLRASLRLGWWRGCG
ncbi:MAG: putative selenium-dependent hydroxylase accessory protein YqeC [Desulfarculus sp.]|nr:putative selenium-dependent hydroxylase accessory protein YqeC [Desulfarculus sp.]